MGARDSSPSAVPLPISMIPTPAWTGTLVPTTPPIPIYQSGLSCENTLDTVRSSRKSALLPLACVQTYELSMNCHRCAGGVSTVTWHTLHREASASAAGLEDTHLPGSFGALLCFCTKARPCCRHL